MSKQIIQQGAEAILYLEKDEIIKDRISKGYRHPLLDKKIIKQRTKSEAKILEKAHKLIGSPLPINVTNNEIQMPFIEGKKLSDNLEKLDWKSLCKQIGNKIALLHDNNIIHGDLTTSNMILMDNSKEKKIKSKEVEQNPQKSSSIIKNNKQIIEHEEIICTSEARRAEPNIIFIDFGLSFTSTRIEDRAVDLHLIKQALEAKHFTIHKEAEKIILDNYSSKDKSKVLEQLKKVEARGRYKG